jgi:hypothetical protein
MKRPKDDGMSWHGIAPTTRAGGPQTQNDAAILARIDARLSGIEREIPPSRTWRPPVGHSAQLVKTERRNRMSWSASLVAASVALLALGASIVVSTAPRPPVGVGSAPAAEAASPSPGASIVPAGDLAVAVVGTDTYMGDVPGEGGSDGVTADSIEQERAGEGYTRHVLQMSDPRLSGELKRYGNSDDFGWPDKVGAGLELMWGTFRLENEGGAWEGPYRGATMWDVEDLGTPPPSFHDVAEGASMYWTWDGWLEGSGDYEGLSAWIRIDVDNGQFTGPVVALIFPGSPPPDR